MTKRAKIAVSLLVGLAVIAGWWALIPKIRTATEAAVRAHVAPALLVPVLVPADASERYDAFRQALRPLLERRPRERTQLEAYRAVFHVGDPEVRRALDILREGALFRTFDDIDQFRSDQQGNVFRFVDGLAAAALDDAGKGDWSGVRAQLEAAYLLVDRLIEGDVTTDDRFWTWQIDSRVNRTVFTLAARRDLPTAFAARLAELVAVDRYGAQSERRILRGDFQRSVLPRIPSILMNGRGRLWVPAGSYDPIETATLLSDVYVEAVSNAGLPVAQWSLTAAQRIKQVDEKRQVQFDGSRPVLLQILAASFHRNTGRNAKGYWLAQMHSDRIRLKFALRARTGQDKVVAAMAVCRFRQRTGRDPRSFDELVGAGLLPTSPLDHATDLPLPFDLQALFEWRSPAQQPQRN